MPTGISVIAGQIDLSVGATYALASVLGALDAIANLEPTVAMLDINLGDATSYAIADRLADQLREQALAREAVDALAERDRMALLLREELAFGGPYAPRLLLGLRHDNS